MIWLFILLLALGVAIGFWRSGAFDKAAYQLAGAALMAAAAGYIWQGRPNLPGHSAEAAVRPAAQESAFTALRPEFFERFDTASHWLIIADSFQRRGETADAVGVIRSGIRAHPGNLALWTGLGHALAVHGGNRVGPASELAYRRAAEIAPNHPAPPFFYGLSLIQSGQVEAGEAVWRDLLAKAPADAKWRPVVADRLQVIDALRTMQQLRR